MLIKILTLLMITTPYISKALAEESVRRVPLTLGHALEMALGANPSLTAVKAQAEAAHSQIRSQYWFDNPRVGLMREQNLTFMQQQMGPMTTWSIAQEVKFPAKYFLLGAAQKARAVVADQEASQKKLEVRTKVITSYYGLFTVERILALLEAQRAVLREIARIAESRHSTGAVPQQDEMKAHVEQTMLEKEFLSVEEERSTMQGVLAAALGQEASSEILLSKEELATPKLTIEAKELPNLIKTHAKHVKQAEAIVEESQAEKKIAYLSYAPDFNFFYRQPFGSNAPTGAYAAGVEFTIPLWFFAKQTAEVSTASANAIVAEKNLEQVILDHLAEVRSLTAKVNSSKKILELYDKGLIPQATSTLDSSRASYRAGRSSFIDLIDSERSLYTIRIAYYRTLAQYVENLTRLEELVGHSISTLPLGEMK